MKKGFNQMIAIVMIAVSSVAFTGCYGSFSLTSKLHNWNGQVSNAKFVNELVFLGLCILPAYELCCLGDALIFNSIEFWGGQNPVAMKAGDVEEGQVMYAGHPYHVTKSLNKMVVASEETDAVAELFHLQTGLFRIGFCGSADFITDFFRMVCKHHYIDISRRHCVYGVLHAEEQTDRSADHHKHHC